MSKKLPIYFSDDAWSSLQELMGPEGKPSPTINTVLEQIAVQNELVEQLGLLLFYPNPKSLFRLFRAHSCRSSLQHQG
jgi:DNA polymerase V